jgi:FMN-dependent NADH-azoreductase
MRTLLQIRTSIHGPHGQSSQLAGEFAAQWRTANPGSRVVIRDIGTDPVPHLTAERFAAFLAKPESRTPEQQAVAGFSDALIEELRRADVIVLGLPLYNFGVPSSLKAYIDHIARAGVTFRYGESGPQGLITGKRVYVCATRGGLHANTALDTQTAYVRDVLRFLGLTDVEFIYAEGLSLGEAMKTDALGKARALIRQSVQSLALAA